MAIRLRCDGRVLLANDAGAVVTDARESAQVGAMVLAGVMRVIVARKESFKDAVMWVEMIARGVEENSGLITQTADAAR